MKHFIVAIAACALLFAYTPGDKNNGEGGGNQNNQDELTVTGAVDLGIVMTRADGTTYSLYWATSNLSEDGLCPNPEDYGDYYSWGETVPHYVKGHSQDSPCKDWRTIEGKTMTGYDWASYKWCDGDYYTFTRYCPEDKVYHWDGTGTPDNKKDFSGYDYADDAARARLGGKWRMPTDAEWTVLLDNCTWTWTTQSGVNGLLVTSKTNGNSIFLPAAGCRPGTNLYGADLYGYYWSSSFNTDYPSNAWSVDFYSDGVSRYSSYRFNGLSVRPVTE